MPKLYVISGCNGSGKTTASYTMLPGWLQCTEFVNSDEFAKGLSPFSTEAVSIQASRLMLMKIHYLLQKKSDFAIETTLSTRSLRKILVQAQSQGYFVTVLYFWIESPELAIERIKVRVASGGHNIPEPVVRRRYYQGLRYFFEDYRDVADRWILTDNTQIPFSVVAQGWRNNMVVKDNILYEKIRAQALEVRQAQEEGWFGRIPIKDVDR